MNTLLAILKVTDARRDVILAGGMYHRFPWTPPPPPPPKTEPESEKCIKFADIFEKVMREMSGTLSF